METPVFVDLTTGEVLTAEQIDRDYKHACKIIKEILGVDMEPKAGRRRMTDESRRSN